MKVLRGTILAIFLAHWAASQENAGTNVAPSLQECYNDTRLKTREYRLPSTISTLVEIIRKIENASPSQNARELSIQILHRFRQDGIKRSVQSSTNVDTTAVLPYSPKRVETYKNRVQLTDLTPGNALTFNNDSITSLEACSLHYMVSSTIEMEERGDEGTVCSRLDHYTSRLHKRDTELAEQVSSITWSSCPVESGVFWTKWGAVKGGLLMAGLAAGFQKNNVPTANGTVETIYASTITGELAELLLNQATNTPMVVGNGGGWNDTNEPKYYFLKLSERVNTHFTDAEIRGSIDGLLLAQGVSSWTEKFSNIKISQILDLYYGRGVFNQSTRACNRNELLKESLFDDAKLVQQTTLFTGLLDKASENGVLTNPSAYSTLATRAVEAFRNYINSGNNLVDLQCSAENDVIERVATDILIFVDAGWNYQVIQSFISYVLQNIDVNSYESSYTVFDGVNCNTIVNKTRSILDFYDKFNLTVLQTYPTGFDYAKVFQIAETQFRYKLSNETDLTGQSTIVLLLPTSAPTATQNTFATNKRNNVFKYYLPDLRILVGAPGTKTSYNDLVTNPNSDIITVPDSFDQTLIRDSAKSIIERLQKLPRAVVNPRCGSSFSVEGGSSFEVLQYVEPGAVNYHRISPQYFYAGEGATLKVKGQGYGTLIVCTSRTDANIRANSTGADCRTINSDEYSADVSSYCSDEAVTNCSPIYVTVEGSTSSFRCTEATCRFPDSIKYSVSLESVECRSSSGKIISSLFLVTLMFSILRF